VAPGAVAPHAGFLAMLAAHPTARLSAVSVDGTPVPVPAQIALRPSHILSGTDGLKIYLPGDRSVLIDVFDRTLRGGQACADVHTLHEPGLTLTVHMFNTLEEYGAVLVIGVPAAVQTSNHVVSEIVEKPRVGSRLARIYKSRTGEILGIDRATTEILGWTSEQMTGLRSLEFIHPDDQGLAIESWAVMMSEPETMRRARIRHRSSAEVWIWFDVAHSPCTWDGAPCFVADLIDVSQEMETQRALEAREQLLAQLAQALPLGVFQIDADHQFLYTNDCLFQMMGTKAATDFDAMLQWVEPVDRDRLTDALLGVLTDGSDTELSVHVASSGGPTRVCQFTLRQLDSATTAGPGAVGCVVDITEQTAMRRELEDKATFDPLTRCYNRASIMAMLDRMLARDHEDNAPSRTAVMFIDLDRFKEINDRYGHGVGDEFLIATAARIGGSLRDGAALGRLGGDEFLVLLPDIASPAEAKAVAQRIADALRQEVSLSIGSEPCRVSIGLAIAGGAATTAQELVKAADVAMYEAKARGDRTVASASSNVA
jgi:diguanylate cyclase (GGDEF)-like protein/PAS domain S-box-containing protein